MNRNTEQLILDAARQQFVQNGFAATRMQEIADQAGINKALLHYYFRSKDKLYQEILSQTLNTIIPQFAQAIQKEGSFYEKLESLVRLYIGIFNEQPEIPFFVMSELSQKRERFILEIHKRSAYFPALMSFLQQMQAEMTAGNIRTMPPLHLLLNIMGMSVFPFMAKPIFCTISNTSDEEFQALMAERADIILDFVKKALEPR